MPQDSKPNDRFVIGERVWIREVWWGSADNDDICQVSVPHSDHYRYHQLVVGIIVDRLPCSIHEGICTLDTVFVRLDRYRWYHYLWPWQPMRKVRAEELRKFTVLERLADV